VIRLVLSIHGLIYLQSIQKWGNYRANLYWEAHLKAGHIPPDQYVPPLSLLCAATNYALTLIYSKIESFIRSKYESRRWAMDGPPPSDPSVLDGAAAAEPAEATPAPAPIAPPSSSSRPTHAQTPSTASARAQPINRQPQPHQLLSAGLAGRAVQPPAQPQSQPQVTTQTPAAAPAPSATNDLFTLDFHNPAPPAAQTQAQPKKDVKQDILSLFSTPSQPAAQPSFGGQFGQVPAQQNVWGQFGSAAPPAQTHQQQQAATTSMMGGAGTGMWGASSGWNAPPAGASAQASLWGSAPVASPPIQQQQSLLNTNDIWASSSSSSAGGGADLFGSSLTNKKDDAFGDLWGGFK
jgi:stromal membrane-associated protein